MLGDHWSPFDHPCVICGRKELEGGGWVKVRVGGWGGRGLKGGGVCEGGARKVQWYS